jgi:hypothetical protein
MYRFGKTADRIIAAVLLAYIFAALEGMRWAILNGRGDRVALIAGLALVFGGVAFWDRWRCRRWPILLTGLPAPRVVTSEVETVKRNDTDERRV